MTWADTDIWSFDVETNGTSVFDDRILTAALVRVSPDGSTLERSWVVNPNVPIPAEATKVNGLTEEWIAEHGTAPAETIDKIATAVRWILNRHLPLVIQNASFDLSMLACEVARYELEPIRHDDTTTVVDPLVLARGIDKNLRRRFKDPKTGKGYVYKLPVLCERYKVPFEETHDATADAIGAAHLARAIAKAEPEIGAKPPHALFTLQRTWHSNNQRSFADWVVKQGKQDQYGDIDPGWPVHSRLEQVHA